MIARLWELPGGHQGFQAFLLDHTVGAGTTAIGTANILVQMAGGAKFNRSLSRGSNAFILTGGKIRSNSVGNVVSIHKKDAGNLRVLREELLHNWQYRRGGLLSLSRLIIEQVFRKGSYPYYTPGTLEYDARTKSELPHSKRPWELKCRTCDRFY